MPLFYLLLLLLPQLVGAQTIYLRPEEALRLAFQQSSELTSEQKTLTDPQATKIEKQLGLKLTRRSWKFYIAKSSGKIDGYALIDNEVGKTEPITFLTVIGPDGTVRAVEILVYREPIGSEVRATGFLRQFRGKTPSDSVQVGKDIKNMTGATLSSRAVALGVKRALLIWSELYGRH